MNSLTDIYKQVISRGNLYASASAATKGKRFKNAVSRFNFLREWEIGRLRRDLLNQTYRHGDYWLFKIHDPKEREIAASPFRDRVVHHAIHDVIEPLIDKTFIFDSYACRKGKGTHSALDRAQGFLRANKYCLHGDIKKYFPSVDHAVLKKIIRLKVKDARLLVLIDEIIDSANDIALIHGKGLPIGNLTSQFFANLYLNELDRFMKFTLKQRYYIRYMDDFLLFSNDLGQLKDMREQARGFLKDKLCLTMHETKSQIFRTSQGIKFLGMRLFDDRRRMASNNVRRLRRRLRSQENGIFHGTMETKKFHESLRNWFGHAKNTDSVSLRRNILLSVPKLLHRVDYSRVICMAIFLLGFSVNAHARACVAAGSGGWRSISWTACTSGPAYPNSSDTASIGGQAITIPTGESDAASSLTFTGTSGGSIAITSTGQLTISGAITVDSTVAAAMTQTISGTGTISAGSLAIGTTVASTTTVTTDLVSTISTFTVSGGVTLTGSYNSSGAKYNNEELELQAVSPP